MSSKIVSAIGAALVISSLVFIAFQLWNERDALNAWNPRAQSLVAIILGAIVYCLSNYLLSINWRRLFRLFNVKNITNQQSNSIYAKSQIAKYIPGNVAHIAGRHFLLRQLGVNHSTLVTSAAYEMLGLSVCATSIIVIGILFFSIDIAYNINNLFAVTFLIGSMVIYFFGLDLAPIFIKKIKLPTINSDLSLQYELLIILSVYLCFFILASSVLFMLMASFDVPVPILSALRVLICFSLAWLLGFITPGSPSGIGIRETIIVLMLEGEIGTAYAIILAVLFRIATIFGDLLFLLISGSNRLKTSTP